MGAPFDDEDPLAAATGCIVALAITLVIVAAAATVWTVGRDAVGPLVWLAFLTAVWWWVGRDSGPRCRP